VRRPPDPLLLPGTGLTAEECLARALPLAGSAGAAYLESRGVPCAVAEAAALRFCASFAGRPAVLAALTDAEGRLASLHGRYLHAARGQDKMLTLGPGGGLFGVRGGLRAEPLLLVEGIFDALSVAVCGAAAVATIGREVAWLPAALRGRTVLLGFDRARSGDAEAARLAARLGGCAVHRLPPPPLCKDWNTALQKRGAAAVASWLRRGGAAALDAGRSPWP
jgi:hypothetical protein